MAEHYAVFHDQKITKAVDDGEEFEDPITWESACPENKYNKFKTISNLQLKKNKKIHAINYWTIESANAWFHEQQKKFDPSTTLPVTQGLLKRVALHKSLCELVPEQIKPTPEKLIADFNKFVQDKTSITMKELVLIKVFLHIGDTTGFLTDWTNDNGDKITGKLIRAKALAKIQSASNGSWLLRDCSIIGSNIIKVYAITIKDNVGTIDHIPIAHVYGFGYVELNVSREAIMPDEGSNELFPGYIGINQPSFIDLLEMLALKYQFNISMACKNI